MACVYRHIRLDNRQPFYIGISNNKKRPYNNSRRSIHWNNVVNKHGYEVQILMEDLTWEEAIEKEKEFIKLYGRIDNKTGILVNMTDGGDGTLGVVISEIEIKKRSERMSGSKNPRYGMCGDKNYMYGKTHSDEAKEKIRNAKVGVKYSQERIDKMKLTFSGEKNYMYGKKHTEETKNKISLKNTGMEMSEETRRRMSESKKGIKNVNFGIKFSDERRKQMSLVRMGKNMGKDHSRSKSVYYLEGDSKIIFGSSYEAERETGIARQSIGKCCNNKIKKAGKHKWYFL